VQVARIPRGIGASTGVNDTQTRSPATPERFWLISGLCRCVPAAPYTLAEPITSEPSRCGLSARPAPDVPDTAVTTTSAAISPVASAGASARLTTVG
jgi:hypothetical protein